MGALAVGDRCRVTVVAGLPYGLAEATGEVAEVRPDARLLLRMDVGGLPVEFGRGDVTKLYPAEGEPEYDEWEFEKCRGCGVYLTPDEAPTVAFPENVKRPAPGVSVCSFACYHVMCAPKEA